MNENLEERWIHPIAKQLEIDKNGPFFILKDGTLLTIDTEGIRKSVDGGKTWSEAKFICKGINSKEPASYYFLQTSDGTIVLVYLNFTTYHFAWDETNKEPEKDCKLEVWSIRSIDDGDSWIDNQRVVEGYNANFFGFIQTSQGRIIFPVSHLLDSPGRFIVFSCYSDNEGKTWGRSNFIDLGGHGHHDGATEPTLAELSNGKILMLIRTNLDCFWQAISKDGGKYWRTINPSSIDASSSPGYLLRLHSGRLVLVWNRVNPESGIYKRPYLPQHSEVLSSWFREELSITLSEDDGKTWGKSLVIARQPGGQLSYPYLFEKEPGEIWIIAGFAFKKGWKDPIPLRLKIYEEDLISHIKDGGLYG